MTRTHLFAALLIVTGTSFALAQTTPPAPTTAPAAPAAPAGPAAVPAVVAASVADCTQTTDRAKAIAACTALIKDAGKDAAKLAAAFMGRASAEQATGDLSAALKDTAKALYAEPSNPTIWTKRADIFAAQGHPFWSATAYSVALKYDPKSMSALLGRSDQFRRLGLLPKAIEDADAALKLYPKSSTAYSLRAYAHQREGHDAEALKVAEQALALDPKSALAYAARGFAKIKTDKQGALDDLKKALELDPKLEAVTTALKKMTN
jgi:tetratricopeptide (TPR) repeat protein